MKKHQKRSHLKLQVELVSVPVAINVFIGETRRYNHMEVALRKIISAAEGITPLQNINLPQYVSIAQHYWYQRLSLYIIIMITLWVLKYW